MSEATETKPVKIPQEEYDQLVEPYREAMTRLEVRINGLNEDYRKKWYRKAAVLQLNAWKDTAGFFYWNYQLYRDKEVPMYATRLDSWDLCRCWKKGWMPVRTDRFMEKL